MLKLEKISKTRELSVLLRAKPTLLTAPFLMALGYALFVHLAAFFLFKIAPLNIGFQYRSFPPVNVGVDLPVHSGVYVALQDQEPVPEHLIVPEHRIPKSSNAQGFSLAKSLEYIKLQSPLHNVFVELEDSSAFETKAGFPAPLSVHLSGSIAEMSLLPINEAAIIAKSEKGTTKEPNRYLFRVLADQSRGEIFWWEIIDSESSKTHHAEAMEILKSLQFAPGLEFGILSGEVEIAVRL